MLTLTYPKKVKFICGLIFHETAVLEEVLGRMSGIFGKIDFRSRDIPFDFTDYYYPEMGEGLSRAFVSFETLKEPAEFTEIKLRCVDIEKEFSTELKRRINIDPGYVSESKLVLLTTKDFSHRVYLGKGIYAEVQIYFQNKYWNDLPWTYPDYKTDEYKNILLCIRKKYINQIKLKNE